ncbi:MAG: chorismate synthase [Paramuribaculum sp.]|nr:chorismate synthase [Paramuribaculum sp.]
MNSFGEIFKLTSFGESHGVAIGGVIDGMPAGLEVNQQAIQHELNRRRPGQSEIVTARKESDTVKILSGIFEGKTTGTPIGFVIENSDQHSNDYENMRSLFRPSHADYTYSMKYGVRDHRGGGRSSARETAARIVAGALAKQALAKYGIEVFAYTSQVGDIKLEKSYSSFTSTDVDKNVVRCPDDDTAAKMIDLISKVKASGDTVGGIITGVVRGCHVGLGDPVFGKLHARLASAMMSINAAKGFDYGMGFDGVNLLGSEVSDIFVKNSDGEVHTSTNNSGGIQGGISNGEDIYFRVAFKPVATLLRDVETIDTQGNNVILHAKGRHDPCVLPRAVPIVEAMAAMVIFDALLLNRVSRI